MAIATITTKGRITIPAQVRTSLGLAAVDQVEFVTLQDGSVEFVARNGSIQALKGLIRKPPKAVSIASMNPSYAARNRKVAESCP